MGTQKHPDAESVEAKLRQKAEIRNLQREEEAKANLQELVDLRERKIGRAKRILAKGVIKAAQVVVNAVNLPEALTEEEARAHKLKTDNARYVLKTHGLEVNLHEVSGKDGQPLFQPLQLSRGDQ